MFKRIGESGGKSGAAHIDRLKCRLLTHQQQPFLNQFQDSDEIDHQIGHALPRSKTIAELDKFMPFQAAQQPAHLFAHRKFILGHLMMLLTLGA